MKELVNKKKKIATIIGVAAIPIAAAFSVNQNWSNTGMTDITLANVEALAKGEGDSGTCRVNGNYCDGGGKLCCWQNTETLYKER